MAVSRPHDPIQRIAATPETMLSPCAASPSQYTRERRQQHHQRTNSQSLANSPNQTTCVRSHQSATSRVAASAGAPYHQNATSFIIAGDHLEALRYRAPPTRPLPPSRDVTRTRASSFESPSRTVTESRERCRFLAADPLQSDSDQTRSAAIFLASPSRQAHQSNCPAPRKLLFSLV